VNIEYLLGSKLFPLVENKTLKDEISTRSRKMREERYPAIRVADCQITNAHVFGAGWENRVPTKETLKVEVEIGNTNSNLRRLACSDCDIAIIMGGLPEHQSLPGINAILGELSAYHLISDDLVLVLPKSHPLAERYQNEEALPLKEVIEFLKNPGAPRNNYAFLPREKG